MKRFKEHLDEEKLLEKMEPFLEFVKERLDLEDLPKISVINDKLHAKENKSFGGYSPGTQEININIAERHSVDVFRTLAHELVHYKQHLDDRLDENSGETGSDIENEANAMAGIILREYAKHSEGKIFEAQDEQHETYMREVDRIGDELEDAHKSGKTKAVKAYLNKLHPKFDQHLHTLNVMNMGYSGPITHPITPIISKHLGKTKKNVVFNKDLTTEL